MDDLFDVFDGKASDAAFDVSIEAIDRVQSDPQDEINASNAAIITDKLELSPVLSSEVYFETYPAARNCIHECVFPKGWVSKEAPGGPPAREYPYSLDPFQQEAVNCLEKRESVLVAAHTSAGKTTVAEYAIAMALRDKQRVIYTSPIKALSNQKYRDMADQFKDVGLMTGDVTINPNASCMIMTTEILRSMLYRGSEICREMAWVVFDEVHYMRDRERGVVWEETMILLPDTVRFVFLSATIPNSREFAEWICRIKHQCCHVIYTDYRPVPLQHYVFPAGGEGVYLIVDEERNFREDNFQRAVSVMEKSVENQQAVKSSKMKKARQDANQKGDLLKVLRMCQERAYVPVIVFAFSKKECENNAMTMKKADLTTDDEKMLIREVFDNAMATLSDNDRELPQIQSMLPFLLKGIGIHHGGLLPILKEVIEILFQENLVKCLFCTETFAMGVNMPAKTVVFSQISKWDGVEKRVVSSGEYIQMSGRAGRRGKDERGLTIIMLTDKVEPETAKDMVLGIPLRLDSQFYLAYNMLLSMIRLEGADPSYIIERSFSQFQKNKQAVAIKQKAAELTLQLAQLDERLSEEGTQIENQISNPTAAAASLFTANKELTDIQESVRLLITSPKYLIPYLNSGRLLELTDNAGWAIFLRLESVDRSSDKVTLGKRSAPSDDDENEDQLLLHVFHADEEIVIPSSRVNRISTLRANVPETNHKAVLGMQLVKILGHERFKVTGLPLLDPSDMKIPASEFEALKLKKDELTVSRDNNEIYRRMQVAEEVRSEMDKIVISYFDLFKERVGVFQSLKASEAALEKHNSLVLREELRSMKRVLRRLEFVDKDEVVLEKGKLGCEISSCDELLLTEMVFQNVFEGLTGEQIISLCSCLILDEKSDDTSLPADEPALVQAYEKTRAIAQELADAMVECKVPNFDSKEYLEKLKPQMMTVVLAWLDGRSFVDIMKMTELFEGSVVRVMRRLEELVRELCLAAKSIGHKELEDKLVEARKKLRRGIIFSASLYL